MVEMLRLDRSEIFPAMQSLIKTFNLQAHNITFKPPEWNIVVAVLLQMYVTTYCYFKCSLTHVRMF